MKVLFVTSHGPLAASSRTRVFDYLPHLGAKGVRATVLTVVPDALLRASYTHGRAYRAIYYAAALWRTVRTAGVCLASARRYDAILIQRVVFPPPLSALLGRCRCRVAFDFDDAIYTTDGLEKGVLSRLQGWLRRVAVAHTLRNAGHAIVENRINRSYATRYCPGASIITGPIDTDRYRPRKERSEGGVVLGWVGKPSTEPYLDLIRPVLTEMGRRHPEARLLVIGARRFDVPGLCVERRPWALETELRDLWALDIGLMPLPDDAWTRGKGGYKLLQYMALGIPSAVSPVGVNAEIVADGVEGFLPRTHDEWVDRLDRLVRDAGLRRRMGAAARRKVEARYSLKKSSTRLCRILTDLAEAGGPGCASR